MRSHLPLFFTITFLQAKSSRFNRNPRNWEFWEGERFCNKFNALTNRKLLDVNVTSFLTIDNREIQSILCSRIFLNVTLIKDWKFAFKGYICWFVHILPLCMHIVCRQLHLRIGKQLYSYNNQAIDNTLTSGIICPVTNLPDPYFQCKHTLLRC